jgi:hypothetical protein
MAANLMLSDGKADIEIALNQGLMFHCLNWGDPGCHPKIKEFFDLEKTKSREDDTRRLPTLDELKKFNEICRQCPKAYLEIHKKECSACGSNKVVTGFAPQLSNNAHNRPPILYPCYCADCGKYLFLGIEL